MIFWIGCVDVDVDVVDVLWALVDTEGIIWITTLMVRMVVDFGVNCVVKFENVRFRFTIRSINAGIYVRCS